MTKIVGPSKNQFKEVDNSIIPSPQSSGRTRSLKKEDNQFEGESNNTVPSPQIHGVKRSIINQKELATVQTKSYRRAPPPKDAPEVPGQRRGYE